MKWLIGRCAILLICCMVRYPVVHAGHSDTVEVEGITVAFNIEPESAADAGGSKLIEGQPASIQFKVQDQNEVAIGGLFPAAWIDPSSPEGAGSDDICRSKVSAFIGGSLFSRAELDLNVYYVLALNQDSTISVVDPQFGFGGSKLLTMLSLNSIGFDWVATPAQDRIFVSLPSTHEFAEITVGGWQVVHHSSDGQWKSPGKLSMPSGQQFLWAATEEGVAVFGHSPFALQKLIKTPTSPIALSFSNDGRFAYAMGQKRLEVIDTFSLSVIKTLELGRGAVSMDYSSKAKELYISHSTSGEVWVVDGHDHTVRNIIKSEPGISMLKFSPDGRWGFLVNPQTDRLSIIDAAKARVVQSSSVASGPEYIAFSDNLAYIRHTASSDIYMVPLDDSSLGRENAEIPAVDTPGGSYPPGIIDIRAGGEGIVQAPGSNAVLISNYRDKSVYFYKEGMAAPMGQFNNYSKSPRAVLAVDRSLSERQSRGTYSTSVTLPAAGTYEAVYFMDSPRVIHCFPFEVSADERNN